MNLDIKLPPEILTAAVKVGHIIDHTIDVVLPGISVKIEEAAFSEGVWRGAVGASVAWILVCLLIRRRG